MLIMCFKNLVPVYSKSVNHCGNIWVHVNSRVVNSELKNLKYCSPEELQAQNIFDLNLPAGPMHFSRNQRNSTSRLVPAFLVLCHNFKIY